jgi:hypothetical protein
MVRTVLSISLLCPSHPTERSSTTATLLQTLDSKLISLAEHNTVKVREGAQHEEALSSVLKEVAERLREKQNASKRAAAGRKDEDGMDVDEPGGSNRNRKYVCFLSWGSFRMLIAFRRAPQEMVKVRTKRNRM